MCVVLCFWLLGCCNWHLAGVCVGYLTAEYIMHKVRRETTICAELLDLIPTPFPASHQLSLDRDNKLRIQGSSICMQMSSHPLNHLLLSSHKLTPSSSLDLPVRPMGEQELLNCQTTWLIGRIVWRPEQCRTARIFSQASSWLRRTGQDALSVSE